MNAIEQNKARQEIIKLHDGIIESMRRAVPDAIRIGEIITEQKERFEHGQFLPWIGTLPFSPDTANRYQALFIYADKIRNVRNLQEAYKQIESFEAAEKRREDERKKNLILERIKTGKKPDGWDRSLDYEYKKRMEYGGYAKIKDNFKMPKNKAPGIDLDTSLLDKAANIIKEQSQKRSDFKTKIRLSDIGKDDPFVDAILDYLAELENDTRRIEACNNIIKVCRNICIGLQSKSAN